MACGKKACLDCEEYCGRLSGLFGTVVSDAIAFPQQGFPGSIDHIGCGLLVGSEVASNRVGDESDAAIGQSKMAAAAMNARKSTTSIRVGFDIGGKGGRKIDLIFAATQGIR